MDSRLRDYCSSRLGESDLDRVFSSLYDEVHTFATQWRRTHNGGDCTTHRYTYAVFNDPKQLSSQSLHP